MMRMTVESLAMNAVKLLADEVFVLLVCSMSDDCQVFMLDKESWAKQFHDLHPDDKDLTMFTITDLKLKEAMNTNMVYLTLKLKRKIATELLTTYLPTILLLLITFVTIFFDRNLFGDAIAVNLTIMLVMTTIFTSKIEELPPSSDMKMIDIWLIFCLIVPFLEVIIGTAIQTLMTCSCNICKPKENDARMPNGDRVTKNDKGIQTSSTRDVTQVWVETSENKVITTSRVLIFVF